jgi:hypothetical protein
MCVFTNLERPLASCAPYLTDAESLVRGQGHVLPAPRQDRVFSGRDGIRLYGRSNIAAIPWPPPMHMVTKP